MTIPWLEEMKAQTLDADLEGNSFDDSSSIHMVIETKRLLALIRIAEAAQVVNTEGNRFDDDLADAIEDAGRIA